jgi:hypothetical protein
MCHALALHKEEKRMGKKPLIGKYLIVGIVVFLIIISFVPSRQANNLLEDGLKVILQTDKHDYQIGEPVEISIYVKNHGNNDITIVFPTTQRADYVVDHYHWSAGLFFLDMLVYFTIPSGGQKLLFHDYWKQISYDGSQVSPGMYSISGWMVHSAYYPAIYAEPVYINIGTEMDIETHGGFGVSVLISNVGVFNASNVTVDVSLKGGVFGLINLSESYDVDNLEFNKSFSKIFYPLGFGPIKLEISATASNAKASYLEQDMSVFVFFVYNRG